MDNNKNQYRKTMLSSKQEVSNYDFWFSGPGKSGCSFGCASLNAGIAFNLSSIAVIIGYTVKSTLYLDRK